MKRNDMLVNGRVILKKPKSLKEKKVYIFQQTEVFKDKLSITRHSHIKKKMEKKNGLRQNLVQQIRLFGGTVNVVVMNVKNHDIMIVNE